MICDPADYPAVIDSLRASGKLSAEQRMSLALKAFTHTADYDAAISGFFRREYGPNQQMALRYGVNPHQKPAEVFVAHGDLPFKGYSLYLSAYLICSPLGVPWLHQFVRRAECLAAGKGAG